MEQLTVAERRAAVRAAAAALVGFDGVVHQAGSAELGPLFAELDQLKTLAEAAQVGVLEQSLTRGDVKASDAASSAGWVREWGTSYRAGGAAALVRVAAAVAKPDHQLLRDAVLGARVPVGNAAVALTEMAALLPRLTPACAETVLAGFVTIAESDGPREIRALRPRLIARYGRWAEFQRREDLLKAGRSLSQPYADDGMAEYRLRLGPEGQAGLEAILGPLAAPQPSTEAGSDPRTSDQRRADALVEVCRRATAAGGSAPVTPKAAVVVTMDFTDLAERTGPGTTLTGELLAPETVRRMACDAAIIPAVLGGRSELLDLGRTVRLVTPKLFLALCLRDRGWTFPGCSRPPSWCDAHHGLHWCDGGATDLANMALLCPRHHTIVHQKDYAATIDPFAVTWHLGRPRPGPRHTGGSHPHARPRSHRHARWVGQPRLAAPLLPGTDVPASRSSSPAERSVLRGRRSAALRLGLRKTSEGRPPPRRAARAPTARPSQ